MLWGERNCSFGVALGLSGRLSVLSLVFGCGVRFGVIRWADNRASGLTDILEQWRRGEENWFGHETRPWIFVRETRSNFRTLSGVSQSKEQASGKLHIDSFQHLSMLPRTCPIERSSA